LIHVARMEADLKGVGFFIVPDRTEICRIDRTSFHDSRLVVVMVDSTIYFSVLPLLNDFQGAPWGADGRQVGTGTGGILSARRVEPVVCDYLPGGRGNQN